MIKIEDAKVFNIEGAIAGMRFPMQSWAKSDSFITVPEMQTIKFDEFNTLTGENLTNVSIGPNDLALAQKLIASGADSHSKFLRQIFVSMNITAPLYFFKEFDTYKIGTTSNSESTMHTLSKRPITKECFSFDGLYENHIDECSIIQKTLMDDVEIIINICEGLRQDYVETGDKVFWRSLIQLLPSSWNQMRHWTANFQVLRKIYIDRRFHKLQEWKDFCTEIEKLPYGKELITFGVKNNDATE